MIDQGEHVCFARTVSHAPGLGGIHGHWLFAKHSLAPFKRGERDFHVGRWRSNNAYEIDVIPGDQVFPITSYMFDAKLLCDTRGMFTMPARNRHYARALAIAKGGNLRRAGKAGANNPDADGFRVTQFFQTSLPVFRRRYLVAAQYR